MESTVGSGASFKLSLPAAPADTSVPPVRHASARPGAGTETILLVEDDPAVRGFTTAFLQEQGYRVLQATSGIEALEVWKWHAPRVRLLLTDMVLEDHMSGLELAAQLRVERPGLPVICTSGHSRETMKQFPAPSEGFRFVQKPCRPQSLLEAMRSLLDGENP